MKTAAIVHEFPSLTQTFVMSQIRGLLELGCDVRIFADGRDSVSEAYAELDYDLASRITYFGLPFKRLRDSIEGIRSALPIGAGAPEAASGSRRASLRLRLKARAFAGMPAFDAIHAHFGPNGVRALELRALGAIDGPIVTSFYGYDAGRTPSRRGYASLFAEGELSIALSDHMKGVLVSLGCPPDRTVIHRLGVDLSRFAPGPRRRSARLEVISIARLIPKKGLEYGMMAIADLAARGVTVRYTIVGTGLLRRQLERQAAQLGIRDAVRFAGAQPPHRVAELLRESDVLLAPSVTAPDGDAEGTPVAILEAQACARPVVATRHAGIPEIVADGESGFLARERNPPEMADHLERLAESPARRETMGIAGRAIVTGNHDIRQLNRGLLGIYEQLKPQAGPESRCVPRARL